MLSKEELIFDKDLYDKCLKNFKAAEEYLGLRMHVHDDDNVLEDGQIFIFNHYARFETVIPVYILYERLGVFTRTIADHQLFEGNKTLYRFLCGAGAVPNNLPGLLPFLAAELLKGRKVSIFPEGAMMKTRKVMNEEEFMIFSHSKQTFRKHHSGAAVLGLTLDLFKRRIQSLFEKGDTERLDHWCDALEFASHDALKASVEKPTLIVPGNITFTPLRIGGNFLSNALKLINRDVSESLLEEAIIEGNILLKETDMDIRFGKAIQAVKKWSWWEARLVDNYFLSIHSLEGYFSLGEQSQTMTTRILTKILYDKTHRIRDDYIKGLYSGVTLNTGHIGASLVFGYYRQGLKRISKDEFHRAFYYTVKQLQEVPDIHLIYSLNKPENYHFLYRGESETFLQWLNITKRAGLIEITKGAYILLDKLDQEFGFHEVRLENPLFVSANEVEGVAAIDPAIAMAMDKAAEHDALYFSAKLWDDELRAFDWDQEKFHREEFMEVNQNETALEGGEPYLLTHKGIPRTGVLLVHGFISSPAELAAYGNHIHALGFNVLGARLAGHGTSPADLATRRWEDWLESVRRSYEILEAISSGVIIVGFSAGGTLALLFASENPDKLKAVVGVCPALKVQDKKINLASAAHAMTRFSSIFLKGVSVFKYRPSYTGQPDTNYQSTPISALAELKALMNKARDKLPEIEKPLLLMQSKQDTVVVGDYVNTIMEKVATTVKELHWVDTDSHHILKENTLNTWNILDEFILKQQ